ncbi:MAG: hypothetical protein CMJ94_12105 [Planctomycetes bacterium]|nr:hypothetical protein [Planctomycetota bacterium]
MVVRLLALVLALFGSACSGSPSSSTAQADGVLAALAQPESVELVALHPYPHEIEEQDGPRFHGYGILGQTELTDPEKAEALIALIEEGIEASDGRVAACFNPRHGLTVTTADAVWDFVICYECLSMQVYRDGERDEGHRTAESVEPQVTAIFLAAGLSMHRDA